MTGRLARVLMSPWRIGAAVATGVIVALVAAWPLGLVAAAAVYGGSVALGRTRRPSVPRIDSFALSEPWRRFVSAAQKSRTRYDETIRAAPAGPLRDRLVEIGATLDEGLHECWQIACEGDRIDAALAHLRRAETRARLQRAQTEHSTTPSDASSATIASLEQQLASADRLAARSKEAADRLRLAQTQLDQLVASAAEVAAGVGDGEVLATGVENVVIELEALRQAIVETNQPTLGSTATALHAPQPETQPPSDPQAMPGT